MKLLSFLTRKQAWLSPLEISNEFRLDGAKVSARTIHRWLLLLREKGGLVYYPYPRANVLALADVLVTIHGLNDPRILGIVPLPHRSMWNAASTEVNLSFVRVTGSQ